ncbi:MAG: hypothetical protein PHN53_13505 [Eubacteriales bacterium]|nr:hypothetical protein [Eubacteriales bacterium]MDD4141018.1 hypothetical protein [Eubacteriales bacterium]MDD4745615.1 hypothetical protein [Eubacteriales bacterium]
MSLILLIAHFAADPLLPLTRPVDRIAFPWLRWALRTLLYAALPLAVLLGTAPLATGLGLWLILVLGHAASDILLWLLARRPPANRSDRFVAWAGLKLWSVLLVLACSALAGPPSLFGLAVKAFAHRQIDPDALHNSLVYALMLLICLAPAAELVGKALGAIRLPDEGTSGQNGALVGMLERAVILILGFSGQLGAIGFVLAAKSIARYKQLEDKAFAEKYLIGTLLSAVISLVCLVAGKALLRTE